MDANKNGIVTFSEFFNGIVNLLEAFGIPIHREMKINVALMADITRISARQDIAIAQCILKKTPVILSLFF